MKNILIVHNFYQIAGGEDSVVANEKSLLESKGHKVVLYTRSNSELNDMPLWRKMLLPFSTVYNPKTARDICNIIKSEQIDIVHVHNTLNLISPSVYYAALKCGVKVVQTIHNFRLLCPNALFYRDGKICEDCVNKGLLSAICHRCYRNSFLQTLVCVLSTKIHRLTGIYSRLNYICLTNFNRDKLLQLNQIKPEKVFVKPNFVISSKDGFIEGDLRKNQVVYAGRLDESKGIKVLIDAWYKMQKMNGSNSYAFRIPRLVIYGRGPLEEWCKNVSSECDAIDFRGFADSDLVRDEIGRSKAVLLPTQWYEGFPMTIVESYSVGTPVICSNIGNSADLVKQGVTGYKFKSVDELINAVETICNNCNADICENAYSEYINNYTADRNYELLMNIYNSVV